MTVPTVNVTCRASSQTGPGVPFAKFTARLNTTEIYDGFVVPSKIEVIADANGVAVLPLFPTELGSLGSSYEITAIDPRSGNRRFLEAMAPVPNTNCFLDDIIQLEPFPPLDQAQAALSGAQSAAAAARQDRLLSDENAENTSSDRQAVADDKAAVDAVVGQVGDLGTAVGQAQTAAGTATGAAGVATAQADRAEDAAASVAPLTVTGASGLGNLLTAVLATNWTATGLQWYRLVDGVATAIAGATSTTYTQQSADVVPGVTVYPTATGLAYHPNGITAPIPAGYSYDIVLVWGSSNAAGRGVFDAGVDTTDPLVVQFNGNAASGTYRTVIQGIDPLKHPEPSLTGVGPAMFFAKAYSAASGRPVLLVPAAYGGTSMMSGTPTWSPYGTNDRDYLNAIDQANRALATAVATYPTSKLVGMLAIPGGNDGDNLANREPYRTAFRDVILGMRAGISGASNAFVIIGQMLPENLTAGTRAEIDAAQQEVAVLLPYCAWAAIGTGYNIGDDLHYNAAGARLMGTTMQGRVASALTRTAALAPGAPTMLAASGVRSGQVILNLAHPLTGGTVTDYNWQYRLVGSGTWLNIAHTADTKAAIDLFGLTASSNYEARAAGVNASGTGAFSNTISFSTTAAMAENFVRLASLTGMIETGDGVVGYNYGLASTGSAASNHAGNASRKIASGTAGYYKWTLSSAYNVGRSWYLGLVTTQSDPAYSDGATGYKYTLFFTNGDYRIRQDGASTSALPQVRTTPLAGDVVRLFRESDGTVLAQVARAATPQNFLTIHAFPTKTVGDVWCAVAGTSNTGTNIVNGPLVGGNTV